VDRYEAGVDRDLSAADRADLTAQQIWAGAGELTRGRRVPVPRHELPGRIVPAVGLFTLLSLCVVGLILLWFG
jgi:hypothetical protein